MDSVEVFEQDIATRGLDGRKVVYALAMGKFSGVRTGALSSLLGSHAIVEKKSNWALPEDSTESWDGSARMSSASSSRRR